MGKKIGMNAVVQEGTVMIHSVKDSKVSHAMAAARRVYVTEHAAEAGTSWPSQPPIVGKG
jgi:hypothetical protein